ncbi:MAG: hypothetical protein U0Q55_00055 [Vicinamibacterales bacterium]
MLDGDRFEGRFRDGVHQVEVSDLMRRMVKESLLKFDGRPLFPERIAYTMPFKLSEGEATLYKEVTEYVRGEFNRAEALQNEKRAGTVGLRSILQRRLAVFAGSDLPVTASAPRSAREAAARAGAPAEAAPRPRQRGAPVATPVLDPVDRGASSAPEIEIEAAEKSSTRRPPPARSPS